MDKGLSLRIYPIFENQMEMTRSLDSVGVSGSQIILRQYSLATYNHDT